MADSEWVSVLLVVGGTVAAGLFLLYATRTKGAAIKKRSAEPSEKPLEEPEVKIAEKWLPLKAKRTVSGEDAKKAREELKTLDLEREILSFAIRRLYEAQAEGKISEEERERLARWYKARMMQVRDHIERSESLVALHELESMQEDLIKLFSQRFDDLNKKVDEMRTRLEIKQLKEETPIPAAVPTPTSTMQTAKEKRRTRKRRRPTGPHKSEADKRIEEIRAEVEKVLERLGQIEVEG